MKNTLISRLQFVGNGSPFAIRLAMSLLSLASLSASASAATLTWAGGSSNTWNSTSSWSPAQIPVNGDDLIFNTASATATNNFANNALTLNSITFSASGQTLGQSATNGINIGAGGVTAVNSTGTSAMVLGVTLTANQTWSVGTGSTVTLNRAFAMGNNTLTKTGAGTLRLTNNAGTSSAGSQFLVQNGILEALYQNDIKSTTAIVLGGGGNATQLKITDGNNANRLTNLQSAISIAAGTTGAVTINNAVLSSASDVTLSGNISLGTSTDADLVFNTTTGSVTKLTGTISGSMTNVNSRGNILFSGGNGEVQFNNANNSFSAVRTFGIQQGVVVLGANDPATGTSNGALGNNTVAISVGTSASPNSGVASLLMDGAFTSGRAITVGNAANNNSVTYTLGGRAAHDSVFSGGITMNRDVQLTAANGGNVTFSGILNDAANTQSVTKVGNGTVILTRANTYDGSTTISAGALTTSNATALGSTTGGTTVANGAALQLSGGIAIGAEALSLTGDGISSGGALLNLSGTNSYAGAITLAGATRINSDAGTLTLGAGGISGTQNLTFGGAGNINVNGVIGTSSGTLTKDGNGILTLGNGTGTSYTGATTVNAGTLVLSGSAYDNRTTSSSALTIATGATVNATFSGSVYSYFGSLAGNGTLNVGASGSANRMQVGFNNSNTTFSGLLNLAHSNSFLFKTGTGALTLSGNNTGSIGQLKFGTTSNAANEIVFSHAAAPGSMLLGFDVLGTISASVAGVDIKGGISFNNNGNFGSAANTNDILVSGAVDLGASTRTITVTNNTTFAGNVSGNQTNSVGLTKSGVGTLTLSGNNTYNGLTTVNAGALNVTSTGSLASGNAFTLGASATANLANAGQTLGAVSNANTATNALNFSATSGTVTLASLSGAGNTRFGSNAVVTGGISTGTVNAVGSLTANITGGTVGAGSLTAGTVSGGTNNITGAAGISTLSGGTTTVGGVATIGSMTAGTANLNGATSAITTLSGGNITLGSSTVLSVSGGSSSGVISGGGGLNKTGAGALELLGVNTYTGDTTVSQGTLSVNGSLAGGVTVDSGATLGGNGTIAGATTVNGDLKPGNSPGLLSFSNSLTLGSNATTTMEITGTATRGVSYDAINVGGALTYGGTLVLNFVSGDYTTIGEYTFNLFDSATTSGSFSNMSLAGIYGGSFTNNSGIWGYTEGDNSWSFNQGDGVLTFTVVPEPNVAMLAGSLALMALLRRRRD